MTKKIISSWTALPALIAMVYSSSHTFADEVRFGGFFSNGYIESSHYNYLVDSEEGDFDFMEAGLNASWTPADRTTVNGQVFAFELGKYGNYDLSMDYLFVDYNFTQEFGIRAGRIKREYGIYNHIQDIDVARSTILLPIGTYDPRYRDMSASLDGISFYGAYEVGKHKIIDYSLYGGFIDLKIDGGIAGYGLTTLSRGVINPKAEHIDSKYMYGAQVWYSPAIEGLRLGFSGTYLPDIEFSSTGQFPDLDPNPFLAGKDFRSSSTNVDRYSLKTSIEYFVGDWTFAGEYIRSKLDYDLMAFAGGFPIKNGHESLLSDSWYISGARRLGRFETALTYAEFYTDVNDRDGVRFDMPNTANNKDFQISLRYDVTDNWTLKIESHSIKGASRLFNQYNQNPLFDEKNWTLWAAKSTFSF